MMKKLDEDDGLILGYGKNTVRSAFKDVISTSKKKGALICGVYEVAEFLQRDSAENIKFCILVKSEDPANQVFCRLIEAYCWEKGVNIIKVDCGVTLTLMTDRTSEEIHYCVLLKKSVDEDGEDGSVLTLLNYIKHTASRSTIKIS